jgi:hypothetical protein
MWGDQPFKNGFFVRQKSLPGRDSVSPPTGHVGAGRNRQNVHCSAHRGSRSGGPDCLFPGSFFDSGISDYLCILSFYAAFGYPAGV